MSSCDPPGWKNRREGRQLRGGVTKKAPGRARGDFGIRKGTELSGDERIDREAAEDAAIKGEMVRDGKSCFELQEAAKVREDF